MYVSAILFAMHTHVSFVRALLWGAALVFMILISKQVPVINAWERLMFAIDPSPSRAFRYAEERFNAKNPARYDIGGATYFFQKASADPTLLYLHHELARIAFLKGDFTTAMREINQQIDMHGEFTPNSYYVRGLIEGYRKEYDASVRDYEQYLKTAPYNWAALNDYAWVLLRAKRPAEALVAIDKGLSHTPESPWLLNSRAIALFELKRYDEAYEAISKASGLVENVTQAQWLTAYPGNDPRIADSGLAAFKKSVADNIHMIRLATASSTVQ